MKLVITVDTEADNQWRQGEPLSLENLRYVPRFQSLCEKFHFVPTYLLTYEVLEDDVFVSLLKKWESSGVAEGGAHLHPWTTPPIQQNEERVQPFPSELPKDLFAKKLETLTALFKERMERCPTSFRAGRWGFDESLVEPLLAEGYQVDCSFTPKINWNTTLKNTKERRLPDHRSISIFPQLYKGKEGSLVEVPMTIMYTRSFVKEDSFLGKMFNYFPDSFLKKALNKICFKVKWLRIFPETKVQDLIDVYTAAKRNNLPVIEFMIHSSELMPGGSPYAKTQESVEKIYDILDKFFSFLSKEEVRGVGLTQFSDEYRSNTFNAATRNKRKI